MFRASRALLCAFALDASAVRQNLQGEKKGVAASVVDAVGALAEGESSSSASLARLMSVLQVTPEAMENLRAALTSVVTDIEQNVETKIKAGFASTQVTIDQTMAALTSTTATAVTKKGAANDADAAWISCVGVEKAKLVAVEGARVDLQVAEQSKVVPCQQQVDRTPFSFEPTLDWHFSCEFATAGNCNMQLNNYKTQVNDMLSTLDSDVQAASASYDEAKAACDSAKADIVAKTAALGAADDAYSAQKMTCLGEHETRQLALCGFGTSLQAKCSDVDSYNSLMADIDQVNGGEYSQPDREAEWDTTITTKCLLNQIIAGADIDSAALASCKSSIDFASQVGVLDRKETEFAQETTPENFTCAETTITFTGQIWEIPQGADPRSSDYVLNPYQPAVNTAQGPPFTFCAGSAPGKP